MVNWEQVINEMELPELRDEGDPSVWIEDGGKMVNLRDLGVRVKGFSWEGTPLHPRKASDHIDNDML